MAKAQEQQSESKDKQLESKEQSTTVSLEDLKLSVASSYLSYVQEKKSPISGDDMASSLIKGAVAEMNPLKQEGVDYLLGNDKKGLWNMVKAPLMKMFAEKSPEAANLIASLEIDKEELKSMKSYLELQKHDEIVKELAGNTTTGEVVSSAVVAAPVVAAVSQEVVSATSESTKELAQIEKSIEVTGDFANIKKVKDAEGHVILESTAETPFVHKDILGDVLGFSLAYYKKTGDALTLTSAYRTLEHQKRLDEETPDLAAAPGKSGHNLGLSIDIEKKDKKIKDKKTKALGGIEGFRKLAKEYHFDPIKGEDWHFDHESLPKADDRTQIAQRLDTEFSDKKLAA